MEHIISETKTYDNFLERLTRKQRNSLKNRRVRVELVDNDRYKRKEIVFHTPDGTQFDWVVWKVVKVKGGKTVRLTLNESRKGQFWKLVHRNSHGKNGWHSQGVQGTIQDCVAYAVKHDFFWEDW